MWWSLFSLSSQDCYFLSIFVSLNGSVPYCFNRLFMIKRRLSLFGVPAARMLRDATEASNERPESTPRLCFVAAKLSSRLTQS
jgi:hypothetical protein